MGKNWMTNASLPAMIVHFQQLLRLASFQSKALHSLGSRVGNGNLRFQFSSFSFPGEYVDRAARISPDTRDIPCHRTNWGVLREANLKWTHQRSLEFGGSLSPDTSR